MPTTFLYFTYTTVIGIDRTLHMLYMNDLKLYPKDYNNLEGLLRIVKGFSENIDMEFGLSKGARATFKRQVNQKSLIMSDQMKKQ